MVAENIPSSGFNPQICMHWVWWYVPLIPALRSYRLEDQEFSYLELHNEFYRSAWATHEPVSNNFKLLPGWTH